MAACEVDHLLLGDAGDAVEIAHLLLPGNLVDVGLNKQACAVPIALERGEVFELGVVDDGRQQVVREVAVLQLLNLG